MKAIPVCLSCTVHFGQVIRLEDAQNANFPEWSEFHHTEEDHIVVQGWPQ